MALFQAGRGPLDPARGGALISTMWHQGKKIYGRSKVDLSKTYGFLYVYNDTTGVNDMYVVQEQSDWNLLFRNYNRTPINFTFGSIPSADIRGFQFNTNQAALNFIPDSIGNNFLNYLTGINMDITFPSWVHTLGNNFFSCDSLSEDNTVDLGGVTTVNGNLLTSNQFGPQIKGSFNIVADNLVTITGNFMGNFGGAYNFNGTVSLPKLKTCGDFMYGCTVYNKPTSLPALETVGNLFLHAYALNQPLSLPKLKQASSLLDMGFQDGNFNRALDLPELVSCGVMLNRCTIFNKTLHIGNKLTSLGNLLEKAHAMNSDIILDSTIAAYSDIMNLDYNLNNAWNHNFEFKNGCQYNGLMFNCMSGSGVPVFTCNCPVDDVSFNGASFRKLKGDSNFAVHFTGTYANEMKDKFPDQDNGTTGLAITVV